MLLSTNLQTRILDQMRKGAKLRVHYHYIGYDSCSFVTGITLEKNGKSINLTHYRDPLGGIPPCPQDDYRIMVGRDEFLTLTEHEEIKEAYAGYHGDGQRDWSRLYEHMTTPTPRWIKEHWDNPVSMYPLD